MFACITSEGVATQTLQKFLKKIDGRFLLQISKSKANFVEGGVVSRFSLCIWMVKTIHLHFHNPQ